jgi:hypothetical protein
MDEGGQGTILKDTGAVTTVGEEDFDETTVFRK